jgi:hypothetical protein
LVHGVNPLSGNFQMVREGFLQQFLRHGTPAPRGLVLSLMNTLLNRQATIMAYNDIFMLMVGLFVCAMFLIPFLPNRPPHIRPGAAAH